MRSANDRLIDAGYDDVVVLDGYDDALIGVSHDNQAIYSLRKMIRILIKRDGMTREEAYECIEYNTIRALPYFGDGAPIIMFDVE